MDFTHTCTYTLDAIKHAGAQHPTPDPAAPNGGTL